MNKIISNKKYLIELSSPKQDSKTLIEDMEKYRIKYNKIMDSGNCVCLTDNPMGHIAFQGTELIEVLQLPVEEDQVMIHLNTFHTKKDLENILNSCIDLGINKILVISGDGSERLPRLQPDELDFKTKISITAVELIEYIKKEYQDAFILGVAFNQYEPENFEFKKLDLKIKAGADFIITQPVIRDDHVINKLRQNFDLPVFIEVWMSKNLNLLSNCIGYDLPDDISYDPLNNLENIQNKYPEYGIYLAFLGFKTQFDLIRNIK